MQYTPVTYKHVSTKEWQEEFPVAYKQWKADTHCSLNHGYSFTIKLYFGANELDKRGWVCDFGGLKELKQVLKDQFDHVTLIAQDDPDLPLYKDLESKGILKLNVLSAMGAELIADQLYRYINAVYIPDYLGQGEAERIWCFRVELRENRENMSWREGHREWNEELL